MRYENKKTGMVAVRAFGNFFSLMLNRRYMGNIHSQFVVNNIDWTEEGTWRTKDGRFIPYSEVTQQHWSNILHHFKKTNEIGKIAVANTYLEKYFEGKLLPERAYLFTTEDGQCKYQGDSWYYVVVNKWIVKSTSDCKSVVNNQVKRFHGLENAENYCDYGKKKEVVISGDTLDGFKLYEGEWGFLVWKGAVGNPIYCKRIFDRHSGKGTDVIGWCKTETHAINLITVKLATEDGFNKYVGDKVYTAILSRGVWESDFELNNVKKEWIRPCNHIKEFHHYDNLKAFIDSEAEKRKVALQAEFMNDLGFILQKYKDSGVIPDVLSNVFKK